MTEREKNNLFYFDSCKCDECKSNIDVYKNRYDESLLCLVCLNNKLKESEEDNGTNVIRRD